MATSPPSPLQAVCGMGLPLSGVFRTPATGRAWCLFTWPATVNPLAQKRSSFTLMFRTRTTDIQLYVTITYITMICCHHDHWYAAETGGFLRQDTVCGELQMNLFCDLSCVLYVHCFAPLGVLPPLRAKILGLGMPQKGVRASVLRCCCPR